MTLVKRFIFVVNRFVKEPDKHFKLNNMLRLFYSFFFFFFVSILVLSGCGGTVDTSSEDTQEEEDYYDFTAVNLTKYGIPALLMLPDETANIGASTHPEIRHKEGDFVWEIQVGSNFVLHIEDFGDHTNMVATKKKELKQHSMFKITYLMDEKDLIVYERTLLVKGLKNASPNVGVEHKSYHVYAERVIDGITFELRTLDEGVEKKTAVLLAKSIKSFQKLDRSNL